MRDLGDSVLTWQDRLTREHCRSVMMAVAAQHRAFLGVAPDDLTPLPDLLALFAPDRMAPFADSPNPLAAITLRGWDIFGETVPADVAGSVLALLADPLPLADALQSRPTTLIHGDLATVNMALSEGKLTLLDWAMPAARRSLTCPGSRSSPTTPRPRARHSTRPRCGCPCLAPCVGWDGTRRSTRRNTRTPSCERASTRTWTGGSSRPDGRSMPVCCEVCGLLQAGPSRQHHPRRRLHDD